MTPAERAASYARCFPEWPAPRADGRWLDGVWVLGNDYRNKSRLYGAFPPGFLKRVFALFPDARDVLHVFSGSLTAKGVDLAWLDAHPKKACPRQVRLDNGIVPEAKAAKPDQIANAESFAERAPAAAFDLAIADPPYEASDAERYGAKLPNKRKVLAQLALVVRPGGCVAWLDTSLPMFAKREWHWFGAFAIVRSTNHRVRLLSLFRRVGRAP